VFHSRIAGAQVYRQLADGPFAARIVNAETPTRTSGTELIGRYHTEDLDIIVTHMYLASTEVDETGSGRRRVPLNPRQTASFDLLLELGPARLGFEVYYTGTQTLEDDPYRATSRPYVLFGILYTHKLGPALLYVNSEDLGDVRQTKYEPLLRPSRLRDGRWSTDAWAPLDGRTLNAGLRFQF
jgi:outer membrane receptor for ferrienterochelin and colicins